MNKMTTLKLASSFAALLSLSSFSSTSLSFSLNNDYLVYAQEASASLAGNSVMAGDVMVSGAAPSLSKITIRFANGNKVFADASESGEWSVKVPTGMTLKEGGIVTLTALSPDEQISDAQITVGTTETSETTTASIPQLTVDDFVEGQTTLSGTINPNATVMVRSDASGDKWITDADDQGNWSLTLPEGLQPKAGETFQITINTVDNQQASQKVIVLSASTESQTESETSSEQTSKNQTTNFVKTNQVNEGDDIITGTTTPKAKVTVLFTSTGEKVFADASDKGEWSVDRPANVPLKAGDTINITSLDTNDVIAHETITIQGVQTTQEQITTANKNALPSTGEEESFVGLLNIGTILLGLTFVYKSYQKSDY